MLHFHQLVLKLLGSHNTFPWASVVDIYNFQIFRVGDFGYPGAKQP